jgi:hypothetical protein
MGTREEIKHLGETICTQSQRVTVFKMKSDDEVRFAVVIFIAVTFDLALKMLAPQR